MSLHKLLDVSLLLWYILHVTFDVTNDVVFCLPKTLVLRCFIERISSIIAIQRRWGISCR